MSKHQKERSVEVEVYFDKEGNPVLHRFINGEQLLHIPSTKAFKWSLQYAEKQIELIKEAFDAEQVIIYQYPLIEDGEVLDIIIVETRVQFKSGLWRGYRTEFLESEYYHMSDEDLVSHIIGHPLTINEL